MNPWVTSQLSLKQLDLAAAQLDLDLTALRLVVLSVGFCSPRELGKFYLIPFATYGRATK